MSNSNNSLYNNDLTLDEYKIIINKQKEKIYQLEQKLNDKDVCINNLLNIIESKEKLEIMMYNEIISLYRN